MDFEDRLKRLGEWFPPADHDKRPLPGGGTWFFVPWQKIRQRLDDVFGGLWSEEYSDPYYLLSPDGDSTKSLCVIKCTIVLEGRSRQGVGQAPLEVISSTGKVASRGTPVERAVADAFKAAAESWGVGRYLDDQVSPAKKDNFLKYLKSGKSVRSESAPSPEKRRWIDLCDRTGITPKQIRAIAKQLGFPTESSRLTPEQATILRDQIMVAWGVAQGVFQHPLHAQNSFLKIKEEGLTDSQLWDRWVRKVGEKKVL